MRLAFANKKPSIGVMEGFGTSHALARDGYGPELHPCIARSDHQQYKNNTPDAIIKKVICLWRTTVMSGNIPVQAAEPDGDLHLLANPCIYGY